MHSAFHRSQMALDPYSVKVLEHCNISPPPNSVPQTSLPLTFFDIPFIVSSSVSRLYFYEYPNLTLQFMNTNILPSLKHSLSLTLQHFFPLAATLFCPPPPPSKPHILYTPGDSVPLTIAESTANFTHLATNNPRDVKEFYSLIPQLTPSNIKHVEVEVEAITPLALQVTIFPNFGICIGVTYFHGVADGRTFNHFMKSWASIFRSKGDLSCIDHKSLPFYDRSVIKDSKGLDTIFWKQWWTWRSSLKEGTTTTTATAPPSEDKFRATFIMGRNDIERLKKWMLAQFEKGNDSAGTLHVSSFVVTCAFIWVCLIKSKESARLNNKSLDDDEVHHFGFVADCRNRDEIGVPKTYFGNCLMMYIASAKRGELVRENGAVVAAKAIGRQIKEFESGVLRSGVENWMTKLKEGLGFPHLVSVAGSPKLGFYGTDFGWGKPKKIEVVNFDYSGPISLTESRDEEGGVEVGLALRKVEMEAFISIFEQAKTIFPI